jgi:hypothetical protein
MSTSGAVGGVVPGRGKCAAVLLGVQAGALRVAFGQPGHRLRAAALAAIGNDAGRGQLASGSVTSATVPGARAAMAAAWRAAS